LLIKNLFTIFRFRWFAIILQIFYSADSQSFYEFSILRFAIFLRIFDSTICNLFYEFSILQFAIFLRIFDSTICNLFMNFRFNNLQSFYEFSIQRFIIFLRFFQILQPITKNNKRCCLFCGFSLHRSFNSTTNVFLFPQKFQFQPLLPAKKAIFACYMLIAFFLYLFNFLLFKNL